MAESKRRLFGTDGVRGIANQEPITPEMAIRLGKAAALLFKNQERRHRIVIGKDTRLSGYMLESALTSGICSMGVDALLVGPLPTPGISFITRSVRADAGVVISASHNPFQDNGIKFFSREGLKLSDDLEREMEELIFSGQVESYHVPAEEVGKAYRIGDASGRYMEFVKASFPRHLTLEGLKVVVDCAHGATYRISPRVFREFGAEVFALNVQPDGTNINEGCGSVHPEVMQEAVVRNRADLGVAHDGDGDRALFADEEGRLVDGDQVMTFMALDLLEQGKLKNQTLVTTVLSNYGLDLTLNAKGVQVVRTAVGDRYVLEEMLRGGYNLGGEKSGHIIFLDHHITGDGLITALQVLSTMLRQGKKLSQLASCFQPFPQVCLDVKVREKKELSAIPQLQRCLAEIEEKLKERGRIVLRYSGTEPLARIMVEGSDEEMISQFARRVAEIIRQHLGAG
ncbi:MAG: phosphoglucosamine mutase [candidate division NC10 bacterium]|nr:phosphoglucosamine mutase [candidate division NC10 bacterium]